MTNAQNIKKHMYKRGRHGHDRMVVGLPLM